MNTLLITNDFPPNNPGGMTEYYEGLARRFPGALCVLTTAAEAPQDDLHPFPVYRAPVDEAGVKRATNHRHWHRLARDIVRRHDVELVLCGNFRPFAYVAHALQRKTGIPYFVFFHGNDLLRVERKMRRGRLKRWYFQRIIDAAAGFVANSSYTAGQLTARLGVPRERVLVCTPGVNDALLGVEPALPSLEPGRPVRLLSVGRLTPRKGVDTVIEALGLLRDAHPELEYTVIGKGDPQPYLELAARHGVASQVTFRGFLPEAAVRRAFREHDVFLMVSRLIEKDDQVEGFGIVFLEANAVGKPVIGGASGGIPDAVLDGRTGLLVKDPGSAAEVALALRSLIETPGYARTLGRQGHERVNAEFRWADLAGRLHEELRARTGR